MTGAASTVPGPQGPAGAASTVPGPQGPAGPAPSGSAGQVIYLTASGVASATANLVINTSNITSLLPIISNITAGLSSTVPANCITGTVATSTTAGNVTNPAQSNITSTGTLTSLTVTGNITSSTGVFTGNGSGLTSLTGSIITGTVPLATTAITVSGATQSNITSLGTLTGLKVNGFTGIGTISPTSLFHVQGVAPRITLQNNTGSANHLGIDILTTASASVPSCQLDFVDDGSTSAHMYFNSKNSSNVLINRLFIKSSGAIGVNTSNPLFQLDINGSCNASSYAGNGSALTSISAGNIVGTVQNANIAVNVSGASQPAITSLGTLSNLTVSANTTSLNMTCSNLLTTQLLSIGTGGSCQVQTLYGLSANLTNYVLTSNLTVNNTATISSLTIPGATTNASITNLSGFPNNGSGSTRDALVISQNNGNTARFNLWGDVYGLGAQIDAGANVFRWLAPGANPTTEYMRLSGPNLGIGMLPSYPLDVNGTCRATAFIGDGHGLSNLNTTTILSVGTLTTLSVSGNAYVTGAVQGASVTATNFYGGTGSFSTLTGTTLRVSTTAEIDGGLTLLGGASFPLDLTVATTTGAGIRILNTTTTNASVLYVPSGSTNSFSAGAGSNTSTIGSGYYIYDASNSALRFLVSPNGNIGVNGCNNPGCSLSFGQAYANKVLSLYDTNSAESVATGTSFFGLGVNSNTLRYNVPAYGQHAFYSGTSNPFLIDGSGNVYCNNSTFLQGAVRCGGALTCAGIVNIPGNVKQGVETYYNANDRYGIVQDAGGTMRLYTSTSYTPATIRLCGATSATSFTDYLTVLTNSGFVGIGRIDPPNLLSLYGAPSSMSGPHFCAHTSSDAYPLFQQLNWAHDNIAQGFDCYWDGTTFRASQVGACFQIYKHNQQLNFNYGYSASPGNAPTITTTFSIGSSGQFYMATHIQPTVANNWMCGTSGSPWLSVYSQNGCITTSDSRLKTSTPLTYGLNEIMKVSTIKYKWNTQVDLPDTDENKNFQYFGVKADELVAIFPELCYSKTYDANGDAVLGDDTVQINYSELTPILINSVKELKRENDDLRSTVSTLQAQLASVLAILSKNNIS